MVKTMSSVFPPALSVCALSALMCNLPAIDAGNAPGLMPVLRRRDDGLLCLRQLAIKFGYLFAALPCVLHALLDCLYFAGGANFNVAFVTIKP